jgi:hypothetical protein
MHVSHGIVYVEKVTTWYVIFLQPTIKIMLQKEHDTRAKSGGCWASTSTILTNTCIQQITSFKNPTKM